MSPFLPSFSAFQSYREIERILKEVYKNFSMTYLQGVVTKHGIVLGADGLTRNKATGLPLAWNQQKLFPIAGKAIVLVHHGQNVIEGVIVEKLVDEFSATIPANYTVESLARLLASSYDTKVRKTQD